MPSDWISKAGETFDVAPNMRDYDACRRDFSWSDARGGLDGLPGGRGLNIAHEAVDRHAEGTRCDRLAIRWLGKDGTVRDFTYQQLAALSARFANVLRELGIGPGDRVYALTGRLPALYIAALGTWKCRALFCSLFSAFGPEPLRARMEKGEAKVLVTTRALYERKVAPVRATLPALSHVLITGEPAGGDTLHLETLLAQADDVWTIPPTDPEDVALLHFTSGTTGTPTGALHVHGAVAAHHMTGRIALDLHPDDVF